MPHLDEGQIHAWLDGELSPTEATAAAQHIAQCAECATMVREARAIIGHASVIVTNLDAPATPSLVRPIASAKSAKRRGWRSSAFIISVASVAIAAGVVLLSPTHAPRQPAEDASPAPTSAATIAATTPAKPAKTAAPSADSAARVTESHAAASLSAAAPASAPQMQPQPASPALGAITTSATAGASAAVSARATDAAALEQRFDAVRMATTPVAQNKAGPAATALCYQPEFGQRLAIVDTAFDRVPARFALVGDPGTPGATEIRTVDSTGQVGQAIPGFWWDSSSIGHRIGIARDSSETMTLAILQSLAAAGGGAGGGGRRGAASRGGGGGAPAGRAGAPSPTTAVARGVAVRPIPCKIY